MKKYLQGGDFHPLQKKTEYVTVQCSRCEAEIERDIRLANRGNLTCFDCKKELQALYDKERRCGRK